MLSVQAVEEEEPESGPFHLRGWTRLLSSINVTEPLVLLAEAFAEPVVVLPFTVQLSQRLVDCTPIPLGVWVRLGCPNSERDTHFPRRTSLLSGGVRKLRLGGSWFTSGIPLVRYAVTRQELEQGAIPRRSSIDRTMDRGWDGTPLPGAIVIPAIPLSWLRIVFRRLKLRWRSTRLLRFWAPIWEWRSWWRFAASEWAVSFSPLIETQRQKLSDLQPDTLF